MRENQQIVELRGLLYGVPSEGLFREVVRWVDGCGDGLNAVVLEYIQGVVSGWPREVKRVLPCSWAVRLVRGERCPEAVLCSTFEAGSEFESLRVRARDGLVFVFEALESLERAAFLSLEPSAVELDALLENACRLGLRDVEIFEAAYASELVDCFVRASDFSSLKRLDLFCCGLDDVELASLLSASGWGDVRVLLLSENSVGLKAVGALEKAPFRRTLECLDVGLSGLSRECFDRLMDREQFPCLRELDVSYSSCLIQGEAESHIALHGGLEVLSLRYALPQTIPRCLLEGSRSLRSLDISQNDIQTHDLVEFLQGFPGLASLCMEDLWGEMYRDEYDALEFAELFQPSWVLERLSLRQNHLLDCELEDMRRAPCDWGALRDLDLSQNRLTFRGLRALQGLGLERLNVSGNCIDWGGFSWILSAFPDLKSLQISIKDASSESYPATAVLRELSVDMHRVTPGRRLVDSMRSVAAMHLDALRLMRISLDPPLVGWLSRCASHVRVLSLRHGDLSRDVLEHLFARSWSCLEELDVSNNALFVEDIEWLIGRLPHLVQLTARFTSAEGAIGCSIPATMRVVL